MGVMTRLLLLLWAGVTVGSVVDLQKRILGGHVCPDNERLYHVQLRISPSDEFVCGGSLISDQWILTAAHCWTVRLYAVVGVHPGTGPAKRTDVKVKPHFFWDENKRIHDIMLLEIIEPEETRIKHVNLPDKCENPLKEKTEVQIAGHGATYTDLKYKRVQDESATLHCADTDVVDCGDLRNCLKNNAPKDWSFYEYQHWFCGQKARVDVSKGDSGGGVVYNGKIYGVNAFTGNATHAYNRAAGFMDVCADRYMKWIKTTTGIP